MQFFCDTTASNTRHINGVYVLLEQKLNRDMLILRQAKSLGYELVLKSDFEADIHREILKFDLQVPDQFKNTCKDKAALLEVHRDILRQAMAPIYFRSKSTLTRFLMKAYEKIDKSIAKAALQKISQHLWYLIDEVTVLSLFDDDVDQETKRIYQLMVNVTSHRRKNFAVHCM
ncbi:hypothetical protein J437_LFUL015445, partial [Ladona fulva]